MRGETGATVAVKVTDEPEMLGLALELTTVVVLPVVLPTVWVNELAGRGREVWVTGVGGSRYVATCRQPGYST